MSAAFSSATHLQYQQALDYWDEFTKHCQTLVNSINEVVAAHRFSKNERLELFPGKFSAVIVRRTFPSTEVKLDLEFEHWGPKISGSVRGQQEDDLHFFPDEFELTIGTDQDNHVVAITGEGRSFAPCEFAKYVTQNFRRCYPGITLPCPDKTLA